jgi:acid phosphatase type 7
VKRGSALGVVGGAVAAVALGGALVGAPRTEARGTGVLNPPVLLAAGDVASCKSKGDEETAAIIDSQPGFVAMLGDAAYPEGSADAFARCYDPSWGRFKDRTFPTPGNHEYEPPPGSGSNAYFHYFGSRAGPSGKGYYSYRLGTWKIIVLNANCLEIGCSRGSEQELWLRRQLRADASRCTLAYWHQPRFSGAYRRPDGATLQFWLDLYAAGVDVILNGHAHSYERYAPQTFSGRADSRFGIREFVVGTGGSSLLPFRTRPPNTEAQNNTTWGVLRLDLGRGSYRWRFLPVAGSTFGDSGRTACHRRPSSAWARLTLAWPRER